MVKRANIKNSNLHNIQKSTSLRSEISPHTLQTKVQTINVPNNIKNSIVGSMLQDVKEIKQSLFVTYQISFKNSNLKSLDMSQNLTLPV